MSGDDDEDMHDDFITYDEVNDMKKELQEEIRTVFEQMYTDKIPFIQKNILENVVMTTDGIK